jgi:hypothetical protein
MRKSTGPYSAYGHKAFGQMKGEESGPCSLLSPGPACPGVSVHEQKARRGREGDSPGPSAWGRIMSARRFPEHPAGPSGIRDG